MLTKFTMPLISSVWLLLCPAAFADNGDGYENVLACRTNGTEIRFDSYGVYGEDGVQMRTQIVVTGDLTAKLWQAGFWPTKGSSNPSEFIIDRLHRVHDSEGPYGNGSTFRIYADAQHGEGTKVSLNGEQNALTVEYRDLRVSQEGLVCSR